MTGDPAGNPPRRSNKGLGLGVAAFGLLLLIAVFRFGLMPVASLIVQPLNLPPLFWLVLVLVLSLGLVAHASRRAESRRSAQGEDPVEPAVDDEPEIRQHDEIAPIPQPVEPVKEVVIVPQGIPAPMAAVAAHEESEDELPKLLDWLKGISTSISQWTVDVAEELRTDDQPVGLHPDEPRHVTTNVSVPKIGSWTDLRARAAIARYLRTRPWAPTADVARALGMDIGLATRITDLVRHEGFQ